MKIRVIDEISPEDVAMLQALYSRSADSVDEHISKVKRVGSGKFMQSYYVGYGHKSIGDCGSTTIFIEGVSLLAAKAIQDWPLYSGQETSTRYIDMARQPIYSLDGHEGSQIIDRWMSFYTHAQTATRAHVREQHPRREGEAEDVYERAVRARTFDILRGFLPAGVTTQLSWHTNLRQARDHIDRLAQHPLQEVRELARSIQDALHERYPSSGFGVRDEDERIRWERQNNREIAYPVQGVFSWSFDPMVMDFDDALLQSEHWDPSVIQLVSSRPRGAMLPHHLTDLGLARLYFDLDFGSFRDLQRHRNGVVQMPLLAPSEFEPWYLDQLPPMLRAEAWILLEQQEAALHRIHDPFTKQYLCALGYQVQARVTMGLPALIYLFELRSSKTVHPTLRSKILDAIKLFREKFPTIKLHVDTDPDDWTVRRGAQTIQAKETL